MTGVKPQTDVRPQFLVVDDDEMVLKATVRTLRLLYPGSMIVWELDSRDAFQTIGEYHTRFALVVSDLDMPGMRGDELCRRVQVVRPTPFILQSGDPRVVTVAAECGAFVGLVKPVDPIDLRSAMERILKDGGWR